MIRSSIYQLLLYLNFPKNKQRYVNSHINYAKNRHLFVVPSYTYIKIDRLIERQNGKFDEY